MNLRMIAEDAWDDDDFDIDDSEAYGMDVPHDEDEYLFPDGTLDYKGLSPGALYDNSHLVSYTMAFIYVPPKTLLAGHDALHTQIASKLLADTKQNPQATPTQKAFAKALYDLTKFAKAPKFPFALGRIGYDITAQNHEGENVVTYWLNRETTPDVVKQSLKLLMSKALIDKDFVVVQGDNVFLAGEVDQKARTANEDELERGRLQVMLHLGATPDGRRLTDGEKDAIRQKLGIKKSGSHDRWNHAGQKAGVLVPGQKKWAMHSESTRA